MGRAHDSLHQEVGLMTPVGDILAMLAMGANISDNRPSEVQ